MVTQLQDDARIITASGDQTLRLWDTGHATCLGVFQGHDGSVKCVRAKPDCPDVFASGKHKQIMPRSGCLLCGTKVTNAVNHALHAASALSGQGSLQSVMCELLKVLNIFVDSV